VDVPARLGQVLELAVESAPLVIVVAALPGDIEQLLQVGADQARTIQDRQQPYQPLDRPQLVASTPAMPSPLRWKSP
jgi:hypothetical protein